MSFRRFLSTLLVLALGFFAVFLAASEWLLRTQVDHADLFSAHLGLFHDARNRNVRNTAFGDSAIARGFLPPSSEFINLGLGGESHFRTSIKLRAFFDSQPAGRVLLVASPHSLLVNDPIDFGDFYRNVFSSGKRPILRILELRNRFFIFRFWREFLASLELEAQSAVGPNGGLSEKSAAGEFAYGRQPLAKRQKDAEALVRAYDRKTKHWDHVRSLYEEMVGFLKTRDADICLVGFPYSASMLQAAKGNDFFTRQTPEFWREFSRAHGIMYVNVIDFFDSDEYFLNETHVNRSGARVISGEILNICFGS